MLKYNIANLVLVVMLRASVPAMRKETIQESLITDRQVIEDPTIDNVVTESALEKRREIIFLHVLGPFIFVFLMLLLLLALGVFMWIFTPPGPPGPFIQVVLQIILWSSTISIGLVNVLLIKQTIAWFQKWRFVRMESSKQSSYRPSRISHPSNWDLLLAIPFAYLCVSLSNGWWPWI